MNSVIVLIHIYIYTYVHIYTYTYICTYTFESVLVTLYSRHIIRPIVQTNNL